MSSSASHSTAQSTERPERSRNAKAQARHRAKRKAYIEQLEQTVTKLQIAMGYTTDQVSCLPPPLLKIRELEQDNARLQKENDDLRRILTDSSSRSLDSRRSTSYDVRSCERDYGLKRRKHGDGMYISPSDTPPHGSDASRPPPPLTIPQPISHHYAPMGSNSMHGSSNSSSVFNIHGPTFQMPNTPSGSSATSSPPFSPAHLQTSVPSLENRPHLPDHHSMSSYSQGGPHYSTVKVEDDHYTSSAHNNSHSSTMSGAHYAYNSNPGHMDWHGSYSSERNLHR